jgi:cold shock protein
MSGRRQQDEILFCERCGISFLWPIEEQSQATEAGGRQPAPHVCAACRHLLPGPDRERGLVKFFNGRKRFGFITRRTGPEIYVHGSALEGASRLTEGDLVEFSLAQTERGPAAEAVRVLERAKP